MVEMDSIGSNLTNTTSYYSLAYCQVWGTLTDAI